MTGRRHDGARAVLLAVEVGVHETVGVSGAGEDGRGTRSPLGGLKRKLEVTSFIIYSTQQEKREITSYQMVGLSHGVGGDGSALGRQVGSGGGSSAVAVGERGLGGVVVGTSRARHVVAVVVLRKRERGRRA